MTQAEAIAELTIRCAAAVYPTLTTAELTYLVTRTAVIDKNGALSTATGWIGTYDLTRAAVQGWRLKAAKASADVDFSNVAGRVQQQQVVTTCLRMADEEAKAMVDAIGGGWGRVLPYDAPGLLP